MMRSPRVRKPSQKAREIAEAMVLTRSNSSSTDAKASKPGSKLKPLPRVKKRIRSDSSRAKIKIGKKQGRAMVNSDGVVDVQEVENTQGSEVEEDEDENALYCICLGHDDHTPMIQCEGCENCLTFLVHHSLGFRFHFSCIQLDATEAQKIEAFYCEVCEASGTGPTRSKHIPYFVIDFFIPIHAVICYESTLLWPSYVCFCLILVIVLTFFLWPNFAAVDELEERQEGTPSADPVSATDLYSPTKEFPLELNHPSNEIDEVGPSAQQKVNIDLPRSEPWCDLSLDSPSIKSTTDSLPQSMTCDERKGEQLVLKTESTNSSALVPSPPKTSRRKQKKAEGLSSENENTTDDEDFTGDMVIKSGCKKRKASSSQDSRRPTHIRLSLSKAPSPTSSTPSTPLASPAINTDKTRKACADQFYKLLAPAFLPIKDDQSLGSVSDETALPNDPAMSYAEAIEYELLDSFGEADSKSQKVPRRQYMTKFRSLLFNLKHNPTFLNSLSSSGISPKSIVHMSSQDFQNPEQRAMAEQVRQRSLQDSVRTSISVPTAKITHKGEEAIESLEPQVPVKAEDITASTTPLQGEFEQSFKKIPLQSSTFSANSISLEGHTFRSPTLPVETEQTAKEEEVSAQLSCSQMSASSERKSAHNSTSEAKRLTADLLSSFDLESVFAAMRSVPSSNLATGAASEGPANTTEEKDSGSDDSMDLENTPEREIPEPQQEVATKERQLPDDYDPFQVSNGLADADLDAILHGDQSTTPSGSPGRSQPAVVGPMAQNLYIPFDSNPSQTVLWSGNVMTADAGGFAAQAIQVGGRILSTDLSLWSRIISTDTMTVVGRLPTKDSTNYLVQSHFAASRELVLLNLLPNIKGPPDLPIPERVVQHQQNLIDFFTKKGRHAVVSVNERMKKIVRDIYLVPLLKHDPLPEFVQLLDDVTIPEVTPRPRDIIIAVLVLQKGSIPSACRPVPAEVPMISGRSNHSTKAGPLPLPLPAQCLPFTTSSEPSPSHGTGRSVPTFSTPTILPSSTSTVAPMPTSSALGPPVDPIPLLQSLTSTISANPNLPFSFLSQLPLSLPTAVPGPGPPPGFVPYIAPQPANTTTVALPPTLAPSSLDLSNVDVSALQALLSNQKPIKPLYPSQQHIPNPLDQPINQAPNYSNIIQGNRFANLPPTPQTPRPAGLPVNPKLANANAAWLPNNKGNMTPDFGDPGKGLLRIGEVIRGPGERRKSGGGKPRRSQEFVAPVRDGGWAGRGRGRSMNRGNKDDHQQRDGYQSQNWNRNR
ncbi:hypothetical protein BY996DRAFT_8427805 [Phakopsora pachyrhizi]|nr:hypothetical protein BY996DRAFT_8427805 [Phakopsora pachyrhizi]